MDCHPTPSPQLTVSALERITGSNNLTPLFHAIALLVRPRLITYEATIEPLFVSSLEVRPRLIIHEATVEPLFVSSLEVRPSLITHEATVEAEVLTGGGGEGGEGAEED